MTDECTCPSCREREVLKEKCPYCGETENLRHTGTDWTCEACFTPRDDGPTFDDLPEVPGGGRATFSAYLTAAEQAGIIDFHLRLIRSPQGHLDFYIHPTFHDGETGDFEVVGCFVLPLAVGAGSSRETGNGN